MTNKKTTKRALLMSVLSILLCVSMLVGTTFAWFTDEVKSGKNIIAAGNLDVELFHTNDAVTDEKVTDGIELFTDVDKWEPGAVAYEVLTVKNVGTLALKYQLQINITALNGVEVDGKYYTLADALKVAVVPVEALNGTREAAIAAGKDKWAPMASWIEAGELLTKDAADTYAVVIYWEPTANDNIFNLNNDKTTTDGGKELTIELGVHLVATQMTNELDSWGKDYDKDAWNPDFVVTTADELKTAIKNVKDGGIIALANDLEFDKDSRTLNSGSWYDGLYYIGDKSFTIDLDGNTITQDGSVNDYLLNFKNDGTKANTITIKNGTVDAATSAYCAIATSSSNAQKITINLENVNLIGNNSDGAVAKIRGGAELNVKAGTVITGKNNYIGIEAAGKNTVVNIFEGAKLYQKGTSSYVGSLVGVSGGATANVYGGSGVSAKGGFIAMTSGGTINISGGEWTANTDGTVGNGNVAVLIAQSENHWKSTINVSGGIFKGGYNCYGAAVGDAQINIKAGLFNSDPATYAEAGYKVTDNGNDTWTVSMESATLNEIFNNVQDGGSVTLPEGTYTLPATIAGKDVIVEGIGAGTVIDFTKANSVGNASVTFKNLHIQGKNENVMNGFGIQGTTGDIVYENCTFDGAVTGEYYGTVTYKNCTFTGTGYITTYAVKSATFENCVFDKADSRAVLVYSHGDNPCVVTLTDCVFKAAAKAYTWNGDWTAAIEVDTTNIPTVGTSVTITNCTFDANYSALYRDKSAAGKANAVITVVAA